MRTLVLGGIRSGKSRWAEAEIIAAVGATGPVCYVATGPRTDPDPAWSARIDEHQVRRPEHWSTVETDDVAHFLRENTVTATLVDDMSGWLLSGRADLDELLSAITGFDPPLVLVSPEVGLTVVPATEAGRRFADEIGTLNQRLADVCDKVVLVVAGQPVVVKDTDDR